MQANRKAASEAIEAFLRALGFEPTGELAGTGDRVAEAFANDLLSGYASDPDAILAAGSIDLGPPPHPLVAIRRIGVSIVCPHHLMPAHGFGTVAFLPDRRTAGLGTIAQAVQAHTRRLVLQEHVGREIAATVVRALGARGALCQLRLQHTCLVARGEREGAAVVETISLDGSFAGEDRALGLAALAPLHEGEPRA